MKKNFEKEKKKRKSFNIPWFWCQEYIRISGTFFICLRYLSDFLYFLRRRMRKMLYISIFFHFLHLSINVFHGQMDMSFTVYWITTIFFYSRTFFSATFYYFLLSFRSYNQYKSYGFCVCLENSTMIPCICVSILNNFS